MDHDGKSRRRRMPRVLGVAGLVAGLLAVGLPAGQAMASPAPASPRASTATLYSLDVIGRAKALGHTWLVDFGADNDTAEVTLATSYKGVFEQHQWTTTLGFAPTAAKELKVTSTGHASFGTGRALSPVLFVKLAFTPVKAVKSACTKGSEVTYSGKVSGFLTLVTGLKKVKIALKFAGKAAASLEVDKSCQVKTPAVRRPCEGGSWFVTVPSGASTVFGGETLGSKPTWQDTFAQDPVKTASKWITRSAAVEVNGPAPKLSTAKKTITVTGLSSGAITGAAVISYSAGFPNPVTTCYIGSKKYKESTTGYFGRVKVIRPFTANSVLAGRLTAKAPVQGFYTSARLTAA